MYVIELYLAEPEAEVIRQIWQELADIGLCGLIDNHSRPHISLAAFQEVDRAAIAAQLDRFFKEHLLRPVTFDMLGFFPVTRVLHAAPTVTPWLLELHAAFHQAVAGIVKGPSRYYLPGRWVPHCTLAFDIPPERVAEAFIRAARSWTGMTGHFDEVGLIIPSATTPTQYLYVQPVESLAQ
jgi:2'-5' RNA ligase